MDIKIKEKSLSIIFLKYLFSIAIGLILSATLLFVGLEAGFYYGLYIPANIIENSLSAQTDLIASVYPFDPQIIPQGTSYALFGHDGKLITSNMSQQDLEEASVLYQDGPKASLLYKRSDIFWQIDRPDGTIIIQYSRTGYYTNAWMQAHLPSPESLAVFTFLICAAVLSFTITAHFAKKLRQDLQPMINAAEEISEQNLDFEIAKTGVKEFNLVLSALSDMKSVLGEALQKQWALEAQRKDQTAALAHDIKTPLTIIRGNADLLKTSNLDEDQEVYADFILKSTSRMEDYLKILVELNASDRAYSAKIQTLEAEAFVAGLKDALLTLATSRGHRLHFQAKDLPEKLRLDPDLVQRALLNILTNAIEHSPKSASLFVSIGVKEAYLQFTITDQGPGFSEEALKKGKDQFYRSDASRTSSGHYGIGLYTCDQIARLHHGRLTLENDSESGGARVCFETPC